MIRTGNAAAWALVCQFLGRDGPTFESAMSDAERGALAMLIGLKAIKPHKVDLRYMLCPYCQLLRGAVVRGDPGYVCQCPECGPVPADPADTRAWTLDADWLIRKLRGALGVPSQQGNVSVADGIWRVGSYQRRPLILARSLDLALRQPTAVSRANVRSVNPPWLITPKPLRDVDGEPHQCLMEIMGLSIRAYARHRGVSDTAVHKAIRAGRITPEADGSIDPVKADREWAKNSDTPKEGTRRRAETVAVKEPAGEPASPALNAGGTSLLQARTVNEVVKAQTNKVRLARLKGELVDRPQAVAHVFKLARAERDAWLNWPARISAQMAAKLGVDAHTLHVALETAVREHLQELGDVRPRVD